MESIYNELINILSCEIDVHNRLVDTANTFNTAIREDNLEEISKLTNHHDELVCQVEKLEERRIECCLLIGNKLGCKSKEPRLTYLIEHAPETLKKELSRLHDTLKQKIDDLSKVTISNQILLENALNIINTTFSFFQQSQKKYDTYGTKKNGALKYQGFSLINRTI